MSQPKVIVLGGCGVVGTACTRTLANDDTFKEVIIGDIDLDKAEKLAEQLGEKVSAVKVDANDKESIRSAIKGTDMVVNCVGPYYKFEKIILPVVIEEKINYVDVNDDTGATYDALDMDEAAKEAGITALIGMGSSPGVTNLLAHYAATDLLGECDSIDMFHTHGGEPSEGPGVIGHRFYCMSNPVPVFLDGEEKLVDPMDSESLEEDVEFINLEGKYHVYPYPHPEPITMPKYIEDIKRVTNKGNVLPEEYYELTRNVFAAGLDSKEPVNVKGTQITPYDFAISYLIQEREKILEETNFGKAKGCVKIVVKGRKKRTNEERTYIFSLVSEGVGEGKGLGEGTGTPAAFGAILVQQGKVDAKGVIPPEGGVNAMDFLQLMRTTYKIGKGDEESKSPLIFESIDGEGNVKRMEF